jgi:hypothetical protein
MLSFEDHEIIALYSVISGFLEKAEPNLYPAFSFSWLELFSNRYFMSSLLSDVRIGIDIYIASLKDKKFMPTF